MTRYLSLFLIFTILLLLAYSCDNNTTRSKSNKIDRYYSEEEGYEDGTYCADVTYYNPNTRTRNTYRLEVDVESNELVKIHWNNGGWLDEEDFGTEELDEDGYCSFTNDRGYEYEVQITDNDCGYTDEDEFIDDYKKDKKAITCPKCGDKKSKYDDYCDNCRNEMEEENEEESEEEY
jgi:hypothetical protein